MSCDVMPIRFSPDVNECNSTNNLMLCGDFADCVNTPGSYVCECQPGYIRNGTEGVCIGMCCVCVCVCSYYALL